MMLGGGSVEAVLSFFGLVRRMTCVVSAHGMVLHN